MTTFTHPPGLQGPGPDGRWPTSTVEWLLDDLYGRFEAAIRDPEYARNVAFEKMRAEMEEHKKQAKQAKEQQQALAQENAGLQGRLRQRDEAVQQRDNMIEDLKKQDQKQQGWKKEMMEMSQSLGRAYSQVLECRNNIQLYCRIKPPEDRQGKQQPQRLPWNFHPYAIETEKERYNFHRVFPSDSSTSDVYEVLRPALEMAKNQRKHVLVIAYGESGSGKSTTMFDGKSPRPGRSLLELLSDMLWPAKSSGWEASVTWLEIKARGMYDLIKQGKTSETERKVVLKNHALMQTPPTADRLYTSHSYFQYEKKRVMKADGGTENATHEILQRQRVGNQKELNALRTRANKNRASSKTEANNQSSRGCCFLEIRLQHDGKPQGALTFIDLMGKEDLSRVGKDEKSNGLKGHTEVDKLCELLKHVAKHGNRAAKSTDGTGDGGGRGSGMQKTSDPDNHIKPGEAPGELVSLIVPILKGSVCGTGDAPHIAVLAHLTDCKDNLDRNMRTLKTTKGWESTFAMAAVGICKNCRDLEMKNTELLSQIEDREVTETDLAKEETGAEVEDGGV